MSASGRDSTNCSKTFIDEQHRNSVPNWIEKLPISTHECAFKLFLNNPPCPVSQLSAGDLLVALIDEGSLGNGQRLTCFRATKDFQQFRGHHSFSTFTLLSAAA